MGVYVTESGHRVSQKCRWGASKYQFSGHTGGVDKTIQSTVQAQTDRVQRVLCDLTTYEHWLDLVDRVEVADSADGDAGPAYEVTLIAKIGPFARRKRLRMVRSDSGTDGATFERREVDGRDHSSWILGAHASEGEPTTVTMRLAYGGGLWSDALEGVLENQVAGAVDALAVYAQRNSSD